MHLSETDKQPHATYRVRLEPALVRQGVPVQALRFASAEEENVRNAHDQIVDHASRSDQVDKPAQDDVGSVADLQEREAREYHYNAEAD